MSARFFPSGLGGESERRGEWNPPPSPLVSDSAARVDTWVSHSAARVHLQIVSCHPLIVSCFLQLKARWAWTNPLWGNPVEAE